jgi:hypothetical protein
MSRTAMEGPNGHHDEIVHISTDVCGRDYLSGQVRQYGSTTYLLVDKRGDPRGGTGIMRCNRELQDGGRIGSKTKTGWKALVEECDKTGVLP